METKEPHIYCPVCVTLHHIKLDRLKENEAEFLVMKCENSDCNFSFFMHRDYLLSYYDPDYKDKRDVQLFWYLPLTKHIRRV